jgi:outer membrane protein
MIFYTQSILRSHLLAALFLTCPGFLFAQSKVWALRDCIEQAKLKNVTLSRQRLGNEINEISYQQAKQNWQPNLNLSDGQNFNFGKYYNTTTQQATNQNFSTNNLLLSSSIVLFNGLQYHNLVKESRANYMVGVLDIQSAENQLGLSVIAAYMQVLYQSEAIAIAKSQLEATQAQLDRVSRYVAVGQLPELNLLLVKAQMAADRASLVNAENLLQLANVSLLQLMEIPVTGDFALDSNISGDVNLNKGLSAGDIYAAALELLPDTKSAAMKTDAAGYALKIAKGVYMPRLTLSGNLNTAYSGLNAIYNTETTMSLKNIGYLKSDPGQEVYGYVPVSTTTKARYPFFDQYKDNFGQLVGLTLSVPIFNNGTARNNVSRARIAVMDARLNESAVKNQLRKTIEQAYTDEVTAAKEYAASKEQLIAEEKAYRNMEVKFMLGAANTTDFLVEKSNYNKVRLQVLQWKYQYEFKTRILNFYSTNSLMP